MKNIFLICLGGFLGTGFRYVLSGAVHQWVETDFPVGTFVVNIVGAFILGAFMEYAIARSYWNDSLRLMVSIGILGGFTTFSTFSYETMSLFRAGNTHWALMNIFVTNLFCLGAVFLGIQLTAFLNKG